MDFINRPWFPFTYQLCKLQVNLSFALFTIIPALFYSRVIYPCVTFRVLLLMASAVNSQFSSFNIAESCIGMVFTLHKKCFHLLQVGDFMRNLMSESLKGNIVNIFYHLVQGGKFSRKQS